MAIIQCLLNFTWGYGIILYFVWEIPVETVQSFRLFQLRSFPFNSLILE